MKPKLILLDDELIYRREVFNLLNDSWEIVETGNPEVAVAALGSDTVLFICDNRNADGGANVSYWQRVLPIIRSRSATCAILLVSQLDESELMSDVDAVAKDPSAGKCLKSDPWLSYLPKGPRHLEALRSFTNALRKRRSSRRQLQMAMLLAAHEAVSRLRSMPILELAKPAPIFGKPDPDTKRMDIVAEESIATHFLPEMHFSNVVICTEERGSHDQLYHRVATPEFFVFSDPFDGSSAFKKFAENAEGGGFGGKTIPEAIGISQLADFWKSHYGSIRLNAPMISIVLAERHRVVGAIIVNVFTTECFVSTDSGNWQSQDLLALGRGDFEALLMLEPSAAGTAAWKPLKFSGLPSGSGPGLFLCSLGAVKYKKDGARSTHFRLAERAIRPVLPADCSWSDAIQRRYEQGDFTPGPGRILFLSDCESSRAYYETHLDGLRYECICSSGEPLTEWMGWFAFLRFVPEVSAYCLRTRITRGSVSPVSDRRKDDDPGSMLPEESLSIFREGYLDLGVLHASYGARMRQYTDSFIVVRDADRAWRDRCFYPDDSERFVRIELHNKVAAAV